MNYRKVLSITEHILLMSLIAGSVGFYLGNNYGKTQVNIDALKPVAIQSPASK